MAGLLPFLAAHGAACLIGALLVAFGALVVTATRLALNRK